MDATNIIMARALYPIPLHPPIANPTTHPAADRKIRIKNRIKPSWECRFV